MVDPNEVAQALGGGLLLDKLVTALVAVAEEVVATRNKGAVSLTLNVLPSPGGDDVVIISEDLQRKPPKSDPKGAIFFAIGDGMLHRQDPRQTYYEVRQGETGATELRVVDQPATRVKEVGQ